MLRNFLLRMIVLADETLETFFDHEFADSFKLTEKVTEQQQSLGREIFNNLLATGSKLAASTGVVRPQLASKSASISTTELEATIDAIEQTKLDEKKSEEKEQPEEEKEEVVADAEKKPAKDEHVLGDDSDSDSNYEEEEEDLSPDVLEEVDRLLKEYGDEED